MALELNQYDADNTIILRSVYGKTEQKYWIHPVRDPKTRMYPSCVRQVDKYGDLILSDKDKNDPNAIFLSAEEPIVVKDGTTFHKNIPLENAQWEAIKNSFLIAPDRYATDENGNSLIDGHIGSDRMPVYGQAELYVYKPGVAAQNRISKKKLINTASTYIFEDSFEHQVQMARLLGKHMQNMPHSDLEDYLIQIAERDPQKIIDLYRGNDTALRIMFYEAVDKHIIEVKDGVYVYDGSINLGGTDDSSITWLKDTKNKKWLDRITAEVYPELTPKKTK